MSSKHPELIVLQRKDFSSYGKTINVQLIEKEEKIFLKLQMNSQTIFIRASDIDRFVKIIKSLKAAELRKLGVGYGLED